MIKLFKYRWKKAVNCFISVFYGLRGKQLQQKKKKYIAHYHKILVDFVIFFNVFDDIKPCLRRLLPEWGLEKINPSPSISWMSSLFLVFEFPRARYVNFLFNVISQCERVKSRINVMKKGDVISYEDTSTYNFSDYRCIHE